MNDDMNASAGGTNTTAQTPASDDTKLPAALSYIFFLLPWLFKKQDDPFVRYHINQAFGLFMSGIILYMILSFVFPWGFAPYGLARLLLFILQISYLILAVKGFLTAWNHKQEPLPFIGSYFPKVF